MKREIACVFLDFWETVARKLIPLQRTIQPTALSTRIPPFVADPFSTTLETAAWTKIPRVPDVSVTAMVTATNICAALVWKAGLGSIVPRIHT